MNSNLKLAAQLIALELKSGSCNTKTGVQVIDMVGAEMQRVLDRNMFSHIKPQVYVGLVHDWNDTCAVTVVSVNSDLEKANVHRNNWEEEIKGDADRSMSLHTVVIGE